MLAWRGREFTADDLTGGHAALIVHGLGADGWDLRPTVGPVHLIAVLGAFVSVAEGRLYGEVVRELRACPLSVLTDALTIDG